MPDSCNSGPWGMYFVKVLFQLLPYPQAYRALQHEFETKVLGGGGGSSSGKNQTLHSFNKTWIAWKTTPPTILRCRGNVFTETLPRNIRGLHSPAQWLLVPSPKGLTPMLLSDGSGSLQTTASTIHILKLGKHKTRKTLLRYDIDRTVNASNNSSIVACIRCRGNVFTEPLPSTDMVRHVQTHRLMGGIYELRRSDGCRCHDIHIKFERDWFRDSYGEWGGGYTPQGEVKPAFIF
jgi:hypothetical protein